MELSLANAVSPYLQVPSAEPVPAPGRSADPGILGLGSRGEQRIWGRQASSPLSAGQPHLR